MRWLIDIMLVTAFILLVTCGWAVMPDDGFTGSWLLWRLDLQDRWWLIVALVMAAAALQAWVWTRARNE